MYKLESNLRTISAVINPDWADSLPAVSSQINAANLDYREIKVMDRIQLIRLGGMTVECTKMSFRRGDLSRVKGIGDVIDLTAGGEPLRILTHEDVLGAALQHDPVLHHQVERAFAYPNLNESWLLPTIALISS